MLVGAAQALTIAPTSAVGLAFVATDDAQAAFAESLAEYMRISAFFEPKSKGGGIVAIGTSLARKPVAVDCGFALGMAEAEGAAATGGFAAGLSPPQAQSANGTTASARARRVMADSILARPVVAVRA